MDLGSDREISRMLAEDCARNIVWLIESVKVDRGVLVMTGWALATAGAPEEARFLVNGVAFTSVRYPLESHDLATHFYEVANSHRARFECYIHIDDVPAEPYLRFEFVQNGDAARARRTAWWYPSGEASDAALSGERVSRVIGASDNFSFELGGATLFNRIQDYLGDRFDRRFEDFGAILDWGCGAGRLLSHLARVNGPQVWGSDIDHDNLEHCSHRVPLARCEVFPLLPPTEVAAATFDLIIGISVCTHLSEVNQTLWLTELRRISRPGGLVMLSVQGRSQSALYRVPAKLTRDLERRGFVTMGVNPRINDIVGEDSYYLDVIQTRAHIREHWGRIFEIVDFLDGFAANQDMVVMRVPGVQAGA